IVAAGAAFTPGFLGSVTSKTGRWMARPELPSSTRPPAVQESPWYFDTRLAWPPVDKIRGESATWPREASTLPQRAGTCPTARSGTLGLGRRANSDNHVAW